MAVASEPAPATSKSISSLEWMKFLQALKAVLTGTNLHYDSHYISKHSKLNFSLKVATYRYFYENPSILSIWARASRIDTPYYDFRGPTQS